MSQKQIVQQETLQPESIQQEIMQQKTRQAGRTAKSASVNAGLEHSGLGKAPPAAGSWGSAAETHPGGAPVKTARRTAGVIVHLEHAVRRPEAKRPQRSSSPLPGGQLEAWLLYERYVARFGETVAAELLTGRSWPVALALFRQALEEDGPPVTLAAIRTLMRTPLRAPTGTKPRA